MAETVLIVAVHPDDETLGCGGTLLKHKAAGDQVHWLIVTSALASAGYSEEVIQRRAGEIEKVAEMYNFDGVHQLEVPATRVDALDLGELVGRFSKVFQAVQPHTVILPFKNDAHSDHRYAFEAAFSCTKWFRYPTLRRLYMMETLSETEFAPVLGGDSFIPTVFVDVSEFMDRKLEIMQVFSSELGEHPFPRSERNIQALGTYRGALAGCEYAESFMLLREVRRDSPGCKRLTFQVAERFCHNKQETNEQNSGKRQNGSICRRFTHMVGCTG